MSSEINPLETRESGPDPTPPSAAAPNAGAPVFAVWWERMAWWFKFFSQPILVVAMIVLLVFGMGWAQRSGWLDLNQPNNDEVAAQGEDVLYICPMVCVPPSTEPGKCPVCGMDLKAQKASGDAKDKYGLKLDSASIRVANIRTVVAEAKPLVREIRAIGEIRYNEGSLATISAYVDARIETMFADYTGVKVNQGDDLALLYSPDLYSSQSALLEAKKLLGRNQQVNSRIVDTNQRLYESSRQRLIELGLTASQLDQLEQAGQADSRIRIQSPISGTVIEKLAEEGQYIKTGEAIYKVADLSTVWLMLELFPRDAAKIRFGQKVVTRLQSFPGREFVGRVAFVDPTVDPRTQTVRVRVVIPNEQGLIRIGDFATAVITANVNGPVDGQPAIYDPDLVGKWISPRHPHVIRDEPGICPECGMELVPSAELGFVASPVEASQDVVVPRDAILMAGEESVAYVETEPGRFEFRNVTVGEIVGDQVAIVSGIEAGERVVSSATMLVDSQFSMAGKPSLIDPARAVPRDVESVDPFQTPEMIAALAGLTTAERAEVEDQQICPVTNMTLGSMGTPLPLEVQDRRVWICCAGCEDPLRKEPDRYFAVLDAAAAENQEPDPAVEAALAGLNPDDRELALRQRICPVTGMLLGKMGTPPTVDVGGRLVMICCEACREPLLEEPHGYLKVLDERVDDPPAGVEPTLPKIEPLDSRELPQIQPLDRDDHPPRPIFEDGDLPQLELPKPITDGDAGGGASNDDGESSAIQAALAGLSDADRELARRQQRCPVADMPLGSMGTPVKVDVRGQAVLICCESCREPLLREPDKYLSRLSGQEAPQ